MAPPLNITIFAFDGVQILDVTGPASVFATANDIVGKNCYHVRIASANGGMVQSRSAVALATEALEDISPGKIDTLLIAGGEAEDLLKFADNQLVRRWIVKAAAKSRRYGSVCTGAFVLAHFGLATDKRIATHWAACSAMAEHYPEVNVDADALYVEDGRVWTSGGVTTGIDMCLAMVEKDLGAAVANAIAKRLVLYVRRPGHQSQFSSMLSAQTHAGAGFSDLINWMSQHLTEPLDIPQLAEKAAMSDRNFQRKFTASIGETPARFVETMRLDQVKQLLGVNATLKEIAARTGFSTPAQFSKAFERRFGISPMLFREMHHGGKARR